MTLRGLLLALALLASQPVEAAACHRYSHWAYPFPQSCGVARQAQVRTFLAKFGQTVSREKAAIELPPERGMPLPGLARADCDGGEADEAARGRLMLRAALEAR